MAEGGVGQIGLGALGIHFAERLNAARGGLRVLDLDAAKVAHARAFGAVAARSPKHLAARSATVLLSLPSPAAVKTVMLGRTGILAGAAPETLVIDTSTVDPATSREVHRVAAKRKVRYLDAPVSSGEPGAAGVEAAKTGTFSFLVGGRKSDFEAAMPVFRTLGNRFYHLGPAGAGSVMKLISNHIAGITTWAVAEGLALAAASGVPARETLEVLDGTVARSYVMEDDVRPRIEARDYEPGFSVDLYHKDLTLAAELGRAVGVPLLFNQLAMEMFQMMRSQGRGRKSHIDCVNYLAELAGVDLDRGGRRATGERSDG